MSEITGQDEARRALEELLDEHADASECAATAYLYGAITDQHFAEERMVKARNAILAALRAPSLDRGAEEMRERAANVCEDKAIALHKLSDECKEMADSDSAMRAASGFAWEQSIVARKLAKAIRALPVPADLNEGGGK